MAELHHTDDVEAFAAAAQDFLDAAPASRNLLRSTVARTRQDPGVWPVPPRFWWIEDGGAVRGCAAWTPPHALLVSSLPDGAGDGLLAAARDHAAGVERVLPGVMGPRAAAEMVAASWTRSTGNGWHVQMAERLHEAVALVEPPRPPGAMRAATLDDLDLWCRWNEEFAAESGVFTGGQDLRPIITRALRDERGFLWEDPIGAPVSMVGSTPSPGMARIGPVYTPPPLRNRGYGRRLTYEVSRHWLGRPGVQRCVLYTDVANPVSNSIYRQIGYRPVEEHAVLLFDGA